MFRARHRPENAARPSAQRGSVGSARVWDERTRALRVAAGPPERPRPVAETNPETSPVELAALIRGIVAVTLDTRLTELERPRRAALASELEARLCALFGLGTVPLAPPEPAPALELAPESPAAPVARPETPPPSPEPARGPGAPPSGPPLPPALRALQLILEDRLERLGGPLAERADLRRLLARLALEQALGHETPPPSADEETLRNLDVLERRAAKLERALHDARAALAYVSGLEHVDAGVASIYRQVQGLAADDPRREQKAGALEKIFRANLELRQRTPDAGRSAG